MQRQRFRAYSLTRTFGSSEVGEVGARSPEGPKVRVTEYA